jgi:hypothetical protein
VPGIEVVIVPAQHFEALEIFVMIDRAQHAAHLAKLRLERVVPELAILDQRIQNVALADRDELIPPFGRGVVTVSCCHGSPS